MNDLVPSPPSPILTTHVPEQHEHVNVNDLHDHSLSVGDRIADGIAACMGSWPFIIAQSCIVFLWIFLNCMVWFYHWDIYPFILLNLLFSTQAAYAAPVIMMSQNRQAEKDRITAQADYEIDKRNVANIEAMIEHLNSQDSVMLQQLRILNNQDKLMMQQHREMSLRIQHCIDLLQRMTLQ